MSSPLALALPALAALVVALATTALLVGGLHRFRLLDVPNERSLHSRATPRGGGLAVLAGLAAATLAAAALGLPLPPGRLAVAVLAVALVGLLDDARGLPWSLRLAVHAGAAALIAVPAGGLARLPLPPPLDLPLGPLALPVAVLWLVAVLNFVNFLDGIDGIAGLQLAVTGLLLAALGGGPWPWLGLALAAGCAGFLRSNWHPARIFLGDVGSGSLGLLVAAAPFVQPELPADLVTRAVGLSLWLFLADATFTLLRRLRRGERIWTAHRSHLYQRLVQTGLSHAQVAAGVGAGAALASTAAWLAWHAGSAPAWWGAFACAGVLLGLELALTWCRERGGSAG